HDFASHPAALDHVVHAVEAAQEGRLAAARRTDQRRHHALGDVEVDIEQGLLLAVMHRDLAAIHLGEGGGDGVHGSDPYQRRSKRRRRKVARAFMEMRNASSTMVPALVFSMKALSGLSAQR